jgi:hypothetical protein
MKLAGSIVQSFWGAKHKGPLNGNQYFFSRAGVTPPFPVFDGTGPLPQFKVQSSKLGASF